MKRQIISFVAILLILSLGACAKSEEAQKADDLIAAIGTVSLESEDAILAAENAVNTLKKSQRKKLDNLQVLESARTSYNNLLIQRAEKYISYIGEITLLSGDNIARAREAFDAVPQEVQALVVNAQVLLDSETKFAVAKINDIEKAIESIGTVTLSSDRKINAARATYDKYDKETQDAVTNYDVLVAAEKTIVDLKIKDIESAIKAIGTVTLDKEKAIQTARSTYDKYDESIKNAISNYAVLTSAESALLKAKIDAIETAISSIGTVGLDSEAAIKKARETYDSYPEDIQKQIKNYSVLTEAEKAYDDLKIQHVEDLISAIGTVTLSKESAIREAANAYESLSGSEQLSVENRAVLRQAKKDLKNLALKNMRTTTDNVQGITWYDSASQPQYVNVRSFVYPYLGNLHLTDHTWMRLKFHYYGDEWVFVEKITIVVDGKKYYKTFNYSDIKRDNSKGYVWETADIKATDEDIAMLRAIASSNETIVRFEGDDYYYDLKISYTDKKGIQEVLDAYDKIIPSSLLDILG